MVTTVEGVLALAAGGLVVALDPEFATQLAPHLDGRPFDPTRVMSALHALPARDPVAPQTSGDPLLAAFDMLLSSDLLEVAL
jgi:hypothetical protein